MSKPSVIIIGAGFTGCAAAHDLALRGFDVTVVERGEICSGTSGRTHGLLHSGGRYCVKDPEAAEECIQENIILRKIAKQCIEFNEGFFVSLNQDDLAYEDEFLVMAEKSGIPTQKISTAEALSLEPQLNPDIKSAVIVPDGAFDPLRLGLAFCASAKANNAVFKPYHEVKEILLSGNNVTGILVSSRMNNKTQTINADIVVNATGAWAGEITDMVGINVPVIPTPGVMVAFDRRASNHVINRMCPPDDGDIVIPQRRMMVIGTTSFETKTPDYIPVEKDQVQQMINDAITLIPSLENDSLRGAYMSARPLIGSDHEGRSLTRSFQCYDHAQSDQIENFVTITGGKATTCRLMAEKIADLVCQKTGVTAICKTADLELLSYRKYYA